MTARNPFDLPSPPDDDADDGDWAPDADIHNADWPKQRRVYHANGEPIEPKEVTPSKPNLKR